MEYGDHVKVQGLQLARVAYRKTEFADATKLAISVLAVKDCNEFEMLITWVEVMEKDNRLWRQSASLLREKYKRLEDRLAKKTYQNAKWLHQLRPGVEQISTEEICPVTARNDMLLCRLRRRHDEILPCTVQKEAATSVGPRSRAEKLLLERDGNLNSGLFWAGESI